MCFFVYMCLCVLQCVAGTSASICVYPEFIPGFIEKREMNTSLE